MATEVELKLVLPDGAAALAKVATLLTALAPQQADVQQQTNYYLDTTDLQLRAVRAMLRVRRTRRHDGSARHHLTAKLRPSLQNGVLSSTEHERELAEAEVQGWRDGPPAPLSVASLDTAGWLGELLEPTAQLHLLGAMHNQRQALRVPLALWLPSAAASEVLVVELDHTELGPGLQRCEIELEHAAAEALRAELCSWLDAAGVTWGLAQESKYAWFLRHTQREPGGLP